MLLFDESKTLEKNIGEEATAVIAKVLERQDGKSREGLAAKEDIVRLEGVFKEDIVRLEGVFKEDIANLRSEMKENIARLETRIAESKVDSIKWMVGLMAGQLGLIALLLRFMLK